ncbi:PseG/SpsG family protein [Halorussus salinus]|uniref:PseG/SpsG family protein n=1 Tax=Halorussus salinus TaxID=1364935 RepID=UPI00109193E3|nr:glycosyltransferase [Halorussus salinus]
MHFGLRADGGPERGFGHLVRTRTLARELLDRGHAVTYLSKTPESVERVCDAEELAVVSVPTEEEADDDESEADEDAARLLDAAREEGIDALVVDRGAVGLETQRDLSAALPLALILDGEGGTVACDLVVNGHLYATVEDYEFEGDEPDWCVGSDYYLLDADLRRLADREVPWRDPPERGLITMGGSDVGNATPDAVRAFDGTGLEIDVIVGPGFQNEEQIDAAVRETDATFDVVRDPDDLPQRMFEADLAVTALGLTVYELLALRTPFVGLPQAPDQYPKVAPLRERDAGLVVAPGDDRELADAVSTLLHDAERRRTFFERGRELVSGDGTAAVADRLEELG